MSQEQSTLTASGKRRRAGRAREGGGQKRQSGGQPGDTDALSHGFYSRTMTKLELEDLDAALGTDLDDCLALMKVLLRRTFDMALKEPVEDPEEMLSFLSSCGLAAMRIVAIVKARQLAGVQDSVGAAISEALRQVAEEWKLDG